MATKKKTPAKTADEKFIVLKCGDCDSEVSGSDKVDVEATMDRHYRATGHSARREALPPSPPPPPAYQSTYQGPRY